MIILWCSDYLVFVAKIPIYPGSSPTSLEQSLKVIWESVSWTWSPQKIHWIKHNSQLLGCAFFYWQPNEGRWEILEDILLYWIFFLHPVTRPWQASLPFQDIFVCLTQGVALLDVFRYPKLYGSNLDLNSYHVGSSGFVSCSHALGFH